MLNTDQIASRLFKKLFSVAETTTDREFFEEPFISRSAVLPSQIWTDGELIPQTAPTLLDGETLGVVKRYVDVSMTPVAGTTNAFQHDSLKDSIPFNFGDGSYNYVIKDNLDNPIVFGQGDWAIDNEAGVLTFYNGTPANMPPKVSFYQYVGSKGIGGASDYIPEALTIYFNTGAAVGGNGGFLKPYNTWAEVKAEIEARSAANPNEVIKVEVLSNAAAVDMDLAGLSNADRLVIVGKGKDATQFNNLDITNSDILKYCSIRGITFNGTVTITAATDNSTFGAEFFNFHECKFGDDVAIVGAAYGAMDNCDIVENNIVITNVALWNINGLWSSGVTQGYVDVNRLGASPESNLVDPAFGCHVVMSNSNVKVNLRPFASDDIAIVDIIGTILGSTGASFTNYANATVRMYSTTFLSNCDLTNGTVEVYNSTITGTISNGSVVVMTPASQLKNDSTVTGTTIKNALEWLASNSSGATKWLETNIALRALTTYADKADIIVFNSDDVQAPPRGYKFDVAEVAGDDGDEFITPDNITEPAPGRWVKKFSIYEKLDQIVLGAAPAGKDWSDGAILFTDATLGSEAIYELNVLLGKLSPAAPIDITLSSAIANANIYDANISGDGATVTCTDDPSVQVVFDSFNDPRIGTLEAIIDTVSEGSIVLTANDDTGVNGALEIISNLDPYAGQAGKEGFYEVVSAAITPPAPLSAAQHSFKLIIGASESVEFIFDVDDPTGATINNVSINTSGLTTQYVSGVPTVGGAENLLVTFRFNDAIKSHYNPVRLTLIAGVGIDDTEFSAVMLGGEPYSVDLNPIFSDIAVALAGAEYSESIILDMTGYNSKDEAGVTYNYDTNIRIDMTSNEAARVISGTGQYPAAGYGGAFDSTQSLKTIYIEELQMLDGKYQVPNGNYVSNQPVAGEDYDTGMGSGDRWVTFQPAVLANNTGFTLDILTAEDFAGEITPDVKIYVKIEGETGWLDANAAYPGVGDPTVDGDPAMIFSSSDGDTKRITLGSAPRSGNLFVRIGLPVASIKKFSGIAISNIT